MLQVDITRRVLTTNEYPATRAIVAVLSIFWLLARLLHVTPYFVMVPGNLASFHYFWTLITAGYYDTSALMGMINIVTFLIVAPELEKAWNSSILARYVLIVNTCVMASVMGFNIFAFAVTEVERVLYQNISGFSGVNAALAVALKQRQPDRVVIPGLNAVKFKHIPAIVCTTATVLWVVGQLGGKESPLVVFGSFFGWFYLRFHLEDPVTKVVGDLREEFGFSTLFPDIGKLRGIVNLLSEIAYRGCLRIGCLQASLRRTGPGGAGGSGSGAGGGGMGAAGGDLEAGQGGVDESTLPFFRQVDPNAERRRALAIKAIDEKLRQLQQGSDVEAGPPLTFPAVPVPPLSMAPMTDPAVALAQLGIDGVGSGSGSGTGGAAATGSGGSTASG